MNKELKIENAVIESTAITMADHGCLTFWLYLSGGGWGCGFGGYAIGHGYVGADKFTADTGAGLTAIMKIMDVVGVDKWEDLKGKYIRCKTEGLGGGVPVIGNIVKDKWFDIREHFKNEQ